MDLEQNLAAGGAPGTVAVGGRVLVVRQPSDADYLTLRSELRRQCKAAVRTPLAAIADDLARLPAQYRQAAIEAAVAAQAGAPEQEPTPESIRERIYHPEGAAFWLWLLARQHHPDLTGEACRELVTAENVHEVLAALLEVTGAEAARGK